MFGRAFKAIQTGRTVIGPSTEIRGGIVSTGTLEIHGQVRGDITHEGRAIVEKRGFCISNIKARSLVIRGEVHGVVTVNDTLELDAGGRLYGEAHCRQLIVRSGAVLQGNSHMEGAGPEIQDRGDHGLLQPPVAPVATAPPSAVFSMFSAEAPLESIERAPSLTDGQEQGQEAPSTPFYGGFSVPRQ